MPIEAKDILIDGAVLEAKELDPNDERIIKLIQDTKKQQADILALTKVDWKQLSETYITI